MKRLGARGRVSGGWLRQGGSNASGRGPFTSGWNEPERTHPEQEFTLYAPRTSGTQGERGETERKVFFLLMHSVKANIPYD